MSRAMVCGKVKRDAMTRHNSLTSMRWLLITLAALPSSSALADSRYQAVADDANPRLQDAVTRALPDIQARSLAWQPRTGYLQDLLRRLAVPAASQVLVFSKTSLQRELIGPATPRAVYFNDDIYVGFVPGGDIEIASVDPERGAVFYVIEQRQPKRGAAAPVRHGHECLECHDSDLSGGVPGFIMRSVLPDARGIPVLTAGSFLTNASSPLGERWGGWYVTGQHGGAPHLGNTVLREAASAAATELQTRAANLQRLDEFAATDNYLGPGSDAVALLVLAHQVHVHNLITRAALETRLALHDEAVMNEALGRPASHRAPTTMQRVRSAGEPLVQALLFSSEASLGGAVVDDSPFAQGFSARGPRDARGRSLRELDLHRRLLRYPCSWLIYGAGFDGLPPLMADYVHQRLYEVLTGRDQSPAFAHLSRTDRQAIFEILRATKPSFRRVSTARAG